MDLAPCTCGAVPTIGVSARSVAVVCVQCRTQGPEAADSQRAADAWNDQAMAECVACGGDVVPVPCGTRRPCPHCGWPYPVGSCAD